jgi:hypothetical protein
MSLIFELSFVAIGRSGHLARVNFFHGFWRLTGLLPGRREEDWLMITEI